MSEYRPHKVEALAGQTNFTIPFNFNEDNLFVSINGADYVLVKEIGSLGETIVNFNSAFNEGDNLTFLRFSSEEPVSNLALSSRELNKEYTNIYNNLQELRYNYNEFRVSLRDEIEEFEIQDLNSIYQRGDVAIFNFSNVPEGWYPTNGSLVSTEIAKLDDKGYQIIGEVESAIFTDYESREQGTGVGVILYDENLIDKERDITFANNGIGYYNLSSYNDYNSLLPIPFTTLGTMISQTNRSSYIFNNNNSCFFKTVRRGSSSGSSSFILVDLFYLKDFNQISENNENIFLGTSDINDWDSSFRPLQSTNNIIVLEQAYAHTADGTWTDGTKVPAILGDFYCKETGKFFYLTLDEFDRSILVIRDGIDFQNKRTILLTNDLVFGLVSRDFWGISNSLNVIYENGIAYYKELSRKKIYRLDCFSETFEEVYDFNDDLIDYSLYGQNSISGGNNPFNIWKQGANLLNNVFTTVLGHKVENNFVFCKYIQIDQNGSNVYEFSFDSSLYTDLFNSPTAASQSTSINYNNGFTFLCFRNLVFYSNNNFETYNTIVLPLSAGFTNASGVQFINRSNNNIRMVYGQSGSFNFRITRMREFILMEGEDTWYQVPDFTETLDSPDGTTRGYIKIRD